MPARSSAGISPGERSPETADPYMPELPEVETIVRDLSGMITGRMIVGVRV
ncbi:MAG: hypothetical protein H0U67_07905, partial [Gemmatimonadetes bacterium]|nr:hypothetical protein [Gemmatimonadota bacterium]